MSRRCSLIGLVMIAVVVRAGPAAAQASQVASGELQEKAFLEAVERYLDVHERAARTVPPMKETDTPAQISLRERLLGQAIVAARPDAVEGEIFGVARSLIAAVVRADWTSRTTKERRALMEELPAVAAPAVNSPYPSTHPLVTTPPGLLDRLPPLPESVEYRLFGRHLILRDVKANLVVDVLRDALTSRAAPRSQP